MGRRKIELDLEKVEKLASLGLTHEQICNNIGLGYSTLYSQKDRYLLFVEAYKKGKDKGIALISNSLFDSARSGNLTAQIFYLKCQAGWKETQVIDNISSDGSVKTLKDLFKDEEELEKR